MKTPSLDKKLLAYAIAAGATAVPANAGIIYYAGPELSSKTTGTPINLDLDGDTVIDFLFNGQTTIADDTTIRNQVNTSNFYTTVPLTAGVNVSSQSMSSGLFTLNQGLFEDYKSPISDISGSFANGVDAYMGLRFSISGQTHYGWALVNARLYVAPSDDGIAEVKVKQYAYESLAETSLLTGQTSSAVPEPSSLALFALGAAGIVVARRRNSARS